MRVRVKQMRKKQQQKKYFDDDTDVGNNGVCSKDNND